jgi:hypothetical protein
MRGTSNNRWRRKSPYAALSAIVCAIACALSGCAGNGAASNSFAAASSSTSGPTVAFESIDGPPRLVFDRMVSVLDSESKLRSLSIVSREGSASYRVRGYLAAEINRGRTTIAWVWDVYDQNQSRALRLSGEEPAGKAGRDAWAAVDDVVLRKIAQAGLSGLASLINGAPPQDAPQPAPPAKRGPVVASTDPAPSASTNSVRDALAYTNR